MVNSEKTYVALDLEMSGFSPLEDEILEVGFSKFRFTSTGVEFFSDYSQVFSPSREVHSKILALTGIKQTELEFAPNFETQKSFLQEELGDAIIVGHSPSIDLAFLENNGVKISNTPIDTLELAQILLPTYHSYNLESLLAHFEGAHKSAHRALSDAQATARLLGYLLALYKEMPQEVKDYFKEKLPASTLSFSNLLLNTPELPLRAKDLPASSKETKEGVQKLDLQKNTFNILPFDQFKEPLIINSIRELKENCIFLVSDKTKAIAEWKKGEVDVLFGLNDYADPAKLEEFLNRTDFTDPELRFALKLKVWQFTNWQNQVLVDLNTSFFGHQFLSLVNCEKPPVVELGKVSLVDLETLKDYGPEVLTGKVLVVAGLYELEGGLRKYGGMRASWGFAQLALKTIYNPETELGQKDYAPAVIDSLAAVDLFYGLTYLHFQSMTDNANLAGEDQFQTYDYEFSKIKEAATNLVTKLGVLKDLDSAHLLRQYTASLNKFFENDPAFVRWIELRDNYCAFICQPISVSQQLEHLTKEAKDVIWIDSLRSKTSSSYLTKRLGIEDLPIVTHEGKKLNLTLDCLTDGTPISSKLLEKICPTVVVFSGLESLREFHKREFESLGEEYVLYTQGYSGGTNKISKNFGLRENSLLLVEYPYFSKAISSIIEPVRAIFADLPTAEIHHPYLLAVSQSLNMTSLELAEILKELGLEQALRGSWSRKLSEIVAFCHSDDKHLYEEALRVFSGN